MRTVWQHRLVLSLALTGFVGVLELQAWPFPAEDLVLALIQAERPGLYAGLHYTYTTLWFSAPFFALSMGFSLLYIFASRWERGAPVQPLPSYPAPETREALCLVLGEQHHRTSPARATTPHWLVIPERGLYTGIAIIGAIGTGKTSACLIRTSSSCWRIVPTIPSGRSAAWSWK
ncbi:MAG: hypothetical protein ABJA98_17640 [Acidobacteriota bacterium]